MKKRNPGPFRTNRFGDRYFPGVNGERFETLGARAVFEQQFAKPLFTRGTFYLVIGTDSGLLPRYVAEKGVPEGSCYLFIELPELEGRIERLRAPRMACANTGNWRAGAEELGIHDYIFADKVAVISSCAAGEGIWEAYRDAGRQLRQEIFRFIWETKGSLDLEVFIRRQLENLAENRVSANLLSGLFKGKTAVLLAGGPSLDDVLPWLAAHRDQVAVIAVSRVSRRLLEAGITPDILIAVDPKPVNFDVSSDMFHFEDESLLVANYHLSPCILGQWGGRAAVWGSLFSWESPLNRPAPISLGPTVTNVAFDTAVELGFSQIVLAGADFCYSREGFTHASASRERAIGARFSDRDVAMETYGGWEAYTHPNYALSARELDEQARRARLRGCLAVNPAPGAAKLEHVRHLPLAEISIESLEVSPSATLAGVLPEESALTREHHCRAVLDELHRVCASVERISGLSQKALAVHEQYDAISPEYRKRLEPIEQALCREDDALVRLIRFFSVQKFFKLNHAGRASAGGKETSYDYNRAYYRAYGENCEQFLKLLRQSAKRVESRLLEDAPAPDIRCLLAQWRADRQPGRARIWRKRHPAAFAALDAEQQAEIRLVEADFEQLRAKGYAGWTATTAISAGTYGWALSGAFGRIQAAYRQKDRETLARLAKVLEAHAFPKAQAFMALALAHAAELAGDHDEALDRYQQVLEADDDQLLEEALRAIAFLCLQIGAMDDALLALEHLAGRSPAYRLLYADSLKTLGRAEEALEAYASYLEEVPDDLAAMLNLGCYYRELGVAEGARMMFAHVLEHDPAHAVARKFLAELG
ncbi:MAG: DUF115 domain-containing protein [Trichloromonas sp.]|jgi:tetratricopeptide (TPR) repeat protein|nr:DUF115 domain-containing protein [Trichloromonas sp.]